MHKDGWLRVLVSVVLAAWILVLAGVIPSLSSERAAAAARPPHVAVRAAARSG
jgi:hypothetical protein